jgi:hypothetical protein
MVDLFFAFYNHQLDIAKFNRVFICLIPKISNTSSIKDFRPISLLNCSFKIFTKNLTSHLHPILDRLIGDNQNAFLKGRPPPHKIDSIHLIHLGWNPHCLRVVRR